MMIAGERSTAVQRWRQQASVLVYPIQLIIDVPVRCVEWLGFTLSSQQRLLRENQQLRAKVSLLHAELEKIFILQQENKQLSALIQGDEKITGKVKRARILAVQLNPSLQQLVIDLGSREKVYVGQPVMDGYGVFGQVIAAGPVTSRVLVATDKHFAVPVQDFRNGVRGIALGTGESELTMIHIPLASDFRVGDVVVTSGLGLRFPSGYPVGVISQLTRAPGAVFKQATITLAAHLDQTQQVLLAWPARSLLRDRIQAQLRMGLPHDNGGH